MCARYAWRNSASAFSRQSPTDAWYVAIVFFSSAYCARTSSMAAACGVCAGLLLPGLSRVLAGLPEAMRVARVRESCGAAAVARAACSRFEQARRYYGFVSSDFFRGLEED